MLELTGMSPTSMRPAKTTDVDKTARSLVERVRDAATTLGCRSVWARAAGRHVILGLDKDDAFARLTPLGGSAYGLAFRTLVGEGSDSDLEETATVLESPRWEPLLLVDGLADVVEHALIAVDALT